MPNVFNNSDVAHVWAQRSQDQGKNSNDSFYFYGPRLYSYGSHFMVAQFVDHPTRIGESIVLFNSGSYSNTTSKHQALAQRAIAGAWDNPHTPGVAYYFSVPELPDCRWCAKQDHGYSHERWMEAHEKNLQNYRDRFDRALAAASRARTRTGEYLQTAERLAREAKAYADWFGLDHEAFNLPGDDAEIESAVKELSERAKELCKIIKTEAEQQLKEWKAGNTDKLHLWDRLNSRKAMLRIKGDNVETTERASVPIGHAPRAFKALQLAKRWAEKHGEAYKVPPGAPVRIGHYNVDSVSPAGLVAIGCHRIDWQEIETIAQALGIGHTVETVDA